MYKFWWKIVTKPWGTYLSFYIFGRYDHDFVYINSNTLHKYWVYVKPWGTREQPRHAQLGDDYV